MATLYKPVRQNSSQPVITCSKSTIETLEQGVKYNHGFENISVPVQLFLLLTLRR